MKVTIPNPFSTYSHRLATLEDVSAIAPLWQAFAKERAAIDPTMDIKPQFDFKEYIHRQLKEPYSYCWVLERDRGNTPRTIVGCLFIYFYDENSSDRELEIREQFDLENPFLPRRIAAALGLYFHPQYRKPKLIRQLINAGIQHAEAMKVDAIELLISVDQKGIQSLLQRTGFIKTALEFIQTLARSKTTHLPDFYPSQQDFQTTMTYTCRLATPEDATAIAPLWANFAKDRAEIDPSMTVKPNFDFEKYIAHQLAKPLSYCWILEHQEAEKKAIAGCLLIYLYDEAPPPQLPEELQRDREFDNPFCDRRVASVLGIYVYPEHRQPEAIKLLADTGIQKAEAMKVSDIDLLVGADQTGMHALLKRVGFSQSAIQYTKHYDIPTDAELPDLHPPHPEFEDLPEVPQPGVIPLRDLQTNELIKNAQGDPVFLAPLQSENGDRIRTSKDLPIYPTPIRNPQTQEYVLDTKGNLVVCPVLRDEDGAIVEYQDIPQFHPPAYQSQNGKLHLKQDEQGNYIFCAVERDKEGKILRNPSGQPIFKQSFPRESKT